MNQTPPCITDKCISYPTCMSKKDIECPEIEIYYNKLRCEFSMNDVWHLIRQFLKEMRTFKTYTGEPEDDPEGN